MNEAPDRMTQPGALDWYKDAIVYELHVRAFADSNGDGIGDFRGLVTKLDYLQDLGVTAIWLLPFYPSPLRDDGYDIADYTGVHANYGSMQDVRRFVREAHARGLKVITELVCNHTSDQHPWFQRARRAKPGTPARDFYVWSDTPERYKDARIIFKDTETSNWTWDSVAQAYFWHRFYSQQPDLNFENPAVHRAVLNVLDFWMELGVDGVRLDAVPYLYEAEGTNCENLPQTHEFLKKLRGHVDEKYPGRILMSEANQWPEDAVAYFGGRNGDECHLSFHFPLMPRMFMSLRLEDRFPIIDILAQTPPIPETSQWAIFLRNHDELTLEMVTDEERDYMYRVYASDPQMRINLGIRRRLAPLLGNNRRRIELMNALLMSMPGTPVLYYGDEIGMGDNVYLGDRNGVRTPMQWSGDRNAGFSAANRQRLYLPVITDPEYHYESVNVEAQQQNRHSLLWWMKRLIGLRKRHPVFGRGTLEFLHPDNRKVLAYVRRHENDAVLVVANLSRFPQPAELDLSAFRGMVPVEMFGRVEFPKIGELPYFVTLAPHGFYWFQLLGAPVSGIPSSPTGSPAAQIPQRETTTRIPAERQIPVLPVLSRRDDLGSARGRAALARLLPAYLKEQRWFGGKARTINSVTLIDLIPVGEGSSGWDIALVQVEYAGAEPDGYALPLGIATGATAARIRHDHPNAVLARLQEATPRSASGAAGDGSGDGSGDGAAEGAAEGTEVPAEPPILYDALFDPGLGQALLAGIGARRRWRGQSARLSGTPAVGFRRGAADERVPSPAVLRGEQSNTTLLFGDRYVMKLYRRVEAGLNPDLEIGRFLTDVGFPNTPPIAGSLELERDGNRSALGILQAFVPNEGDAWRFTLDALGQSLERGVVRGAPPAGVSAATSALLRLAAHEPTEQALDVFADDLTEMRLLGQRTAEMHLALASRTDDPAFAPEVLSAMDQRSIYQGVRNQARQVLPLLQSRMGTLPEGCQRVARGLLEREADLVRHAAPLLDRRVTAIRTRVHGDYHLGQVLWTGKDFVIIDFEGEPARPLSERRLKRSPLVDVGGMLRSFDYAARTAISAAGARGLVAPGGSDILEGWARFWTASVSAAFLRGYLETAAGSPIVPADPEDVRVLLDAHLFNKALYELGYELNNRPDWVEIPLGAIVELLDQPKG